MCVRTQVFSLLAEAKHVFLHTDNKTQAILVHAILLFILNLVMMENRFQVKRIRGELEAELGREPTKPELALEAGLSVQQVEACLEQVRFQYFRVLVYCM